MLPGQQAAPLRSCLKVRNSAQHQGFSRRPREGWVPPERGSGTLRWISNQGGCFPYQGPLAAQGPVSYPIPCSKCWVNPSTPSGLNWELVSSHIWGKKKEFRRTNAQIYAVNGVSDKQKQKLCRHKELFTKRDFFESHTMWLGCYLWQGLHPQIFSLRNSFFCHIITKCGQNSRLGILLLASIEPPFNYIFLFTLSCIPVWFLAKIHFKEIVLCLPASYALMPTLSHIPRDMCKGKRQVMLQQRWSYPGADWPVVDISASLAECCQIELQRLNLLCFPTIGDTKFGFSFLPPCGFSWSL